MIILKSTLTPLITDPTYYSSFFVDTTGTTIYHFRNYRNEVSPVKKSPPQTAASEACKTPCFDHNKVATIKAVLSKKGSLPELVDFYKLLGNTTRLKILFALGESELCVCDIAHVLELSTAATSHQLKSLRQQGWLRKRDDGKMVYYRLHNLDLLETLKDDIKMVEARLL